jgi:hypothetical protein
MEERRHTERRPFGYYMQIFDDRTQNMVGHLSNISPDGFKIDSSSPISIGQEFRLRLSLTSEISARPYIVFSARTKWCQPDSMQPFSHYIGFEIIKIGHDDNEIYQRIVSKYGSPNRSW